MEPTHLKQGNSETEEYYKELVGFHQGFRQLGGPICGPYFREMLKQCNKLGAKELAADHFLDMASIDIMFVIGGDETKTNADGRLKPGVYKFSVGKNPLRYIADAYVPMSIWYKKDYNDPNIREFVANCLSVIFRTVIDRASRRKGRLKDKQKTIAALDKFVEDFLKMDTTLPEFMLKAKAQQ